MDKLIQKKITFILSLMIVLLFTNSCSKDEDTNNPNPNPNPNPTQPTTGILIGKVTPIGAAINVVATPSSGTTLLTTTDSSGNFVINNVTPGSYTITVNPSTGYGQPNPISRIVIAGETSDVGTIQMPFTTSSGSVTYTLDGVNYNIVPPFAYCSFTTPDFLVGADSGPINSDHIGLSLRLNNVNGAGNYLTGTSLNKTIRILQYVGSTIYAWSTINGGSGTVNITTLNTITHTCSGTFTVNAVPENNFTTGNKVITNGVFTNLIYQ